MFLKIILNDFYYIDLKCMLYDINKKINNFFRFLWTYIRSKSKNKNVSSHIGTTIHHTIFFIGNTFYFSLYKPYTKCDWHPSTSRVQKTDIFRSWGYLVDGIPPVVLHGISDGVSGRTVENHWTINIHPPPVIPYRRPPGLFNYARYDGNTVYLSWCCRKPQP